MLACSQWGVLNSLREDAINWYGPPSERCPWYVFRLKRKENCKKKKKCVYCVYICVLWSDRKLHICCCLVTKLCLNLLQPHGCRPLGSSVHGISQARILEWVAISSRGSWQLRNWTCISYVGRRILLPLSHREAHTCVGIYILSVCKHRKSLGENYTKLGRGGA